VRAQPYNKFKLDLEDPFQKPPPIPQTYSTRSGMKPPPRDGNYIPEHIDGSYILNEVNKIYKRNPFSPQDVTPTS